MNHTAPLYLPSPKLGFDNTMGFVRYCLATAVIVDHFNVIFGTSVFFPISSYNAVGAFFALSGFLVFGSYLKHQSIKKYVISRARRILPPYLFIVLICAIGLVSVSSYTPKEYYSNNNFWEYLAANLSFLNFLHPTLPGVFTDSTVQAVNSSLWTMKIEITLYLLIPPFVGLLIWNHRRKKPLKINVIIMIIYLVSMIYRGAFQFLYEATGKEIYNILGRQILGQLMFFFSGIAIYFNYEIFLKYKNRLILPLLILCFVGNRIPYYSIAAGPFVISLLALTLSTFKGPLKLFNYNNISYEMYLFHFPLLQLLYLFYNSYNLSLVFIGGYILIILLASFSWFVIDKRFLPKLFI